MCKATTTQIMPKITRLEKLSHYKDHELQQTRAEVVALLYEEIGKVATVDNIFKLRFMKRRATTVVDNGKDRVKNETEKEKIRERSREIYMQNKDTILESKKQKRRKISSLELS